MTRLRILAVDDDPMVLDLIQDMLVDEYQVQATTDPHVALALLDREDFDLLLLDLGMPRMDGVEIIREVRARPRLSNLPIVLVSAYMGLRKRVIGLDVQAILRKPFELDDLHQTLHKVLTEHGVKSGPLFLNK